MLYTLLAEVPTNIFLRQGLIVNILPFISHIIFITTQQCHHSEKRAIGNIYANEKLCVSKKTVYLKKKKSSPRFGPQPAVPEFSDCKEDV